ncbi:MAG: hypothetical protein KIT43_10140 [Bauldia sp.]|nr:hypothetical protein [Bauldia sp.]
MGLLRRALNALRDRATGARIGAILLGGQPAGSPTGTFAIGVYRKLIAAAVGGLLAFLHVRFGWDLASFFGDGFELGLIEAITAWLVWRLPNDAPASGRRP